MNEAEQQGQKVGQQAQKAVGQAGKAVGKKAAKLVKKVAGGIIKKALAALVSAVGPWGIAIGVGLVIILAIIYPVLFGNDQQTQTEMVGYQTYVDTMDNAVIPIGIDKSFDFYDYEEPAWLFPALDKLKAMVINDAKNSNIVGTDAYGEVTVSSDAYAYAAVKYVPDLAMQMPKTTTMYKVTTTTDVRTIFNPGFGKNNIGGGTRTIHFPPQVEQDPLIEPLEIDTWNGEHYLTYKMFQEKPIVNTTRQDDAGEIITDTITVQIAIPVKASERWNRDFSRLQAVLTKMGFPENQGYLGTVVAMGLSNDGMVANWGSSDPTVVTKTYSALYPVKDAMLRWPLPGHHKLSAQMGAILDPVTGAPYFNTGINIMAPEGTPTRASSAGKVVVVNAQDNSGLGDYVAVQGTLKGLPSPVQVLYAYLDRIAPGIKVGAPVKAGDVLGYIGPDKSGAPNLFLQTSYQGYQVDPTAFFMNEPGVLTETDLWGYAAPVGGGASTSIPPQQYLPWFQQAAAEYSCPEAILLAIGDVESGYNPRAVGPLIDRYAGTQDAHALGMMQFLPSTFGEYGRADGNMDPSIWDPRDAIFAAAKMLSDDGIAVDPHDAILSYNDSDSYVAEVISLAQSTYAKYASDDSGV